jgi:predicted RNA-binding protein YlxR (DUF448 family)
MKSKKVPMRTCVVTKEKLEKKDLVRIVRTNEGKVVIDLTGKLNGRGAYIKKDIEAINKAKKSKALDRNLEIEIPNEIYEELTNIISK